MFTSGVLILEMSLHVLLHIYVDVTVALEVYQVSAVSFP